MNHNPNEEAPINTFVRINEKIRVPDVRCIGPGGDQIGILPTRQAIALARGQDLDLVEIAPTARPPVCRIMDFGKYKYEIGKKEKEARKHQASNRVKEVKFHTSVAEHDYQTKLRHTREFLHDGHKVKVSLYFRGREGMHKEFGFDLMNRVARECDDLATMEQTPTQLGRGLIMRLSPRPGLKAKPKRAPETAAH